MTRLDLTASELRKVASGEKDGAAARRILALTLVLDGVDRKMAAETCGMDRQTLRVWVHRYNIAGLAGLRNLKSPGPGSKLTARQQAELTELVEAGPDPAAHGVVRWRRVNLRDELQRRFGVGLAMPFSSSMAPAIIVLPRSRFPKTSPSCVCHPRHLNSTRSKTLGIKKLAPRGPMSVLSSCCTIPSARTHRWTTGHRRQRPCNGRLCYADQLRWPHQPWRQNRSCTNIQPRPPVGAGHQGTNQRRNDD